MAYSGAYAKTPNSQTMTWQPGKEPDQIRYFELDFSTTGRGVSMVLREAGWDSASGWSDAAAKLGAVVKNGKFTNQGQPVIDQSPRPGGKKPLGISLGAPAPRPGGTSPYGAASQCLYVVKLATGPGSSGTDWQFSRSFAPFSLGDRSYEGGPGKPIELQDMFSHASLIDEGSGALIHPDPEEQADGTYPQTHWACFLFDYAFAQANVGKLFALRYNTHVEILDQVSQEFIPLMIDPDIGEPGGGYP